MSATTTTPATAALPAPACTAATPPATALPCPACGEDCNFAVNLYQLEDDNAFTCGGCGAEFSFVLLRKVVNVWSRALARIAAMAELLSEDAQEFDEEGMPIASDAAAE